MNSSLYIIPKPTGQANFIYQVQLELSNPGKKSPPISDDLTWCYEGKKMNKISCLGAAMCECCLICKELAMKFSSDHLLKAKSITSTLKMY